MGHFFSGSFRSPGLAQKSVFVRPNKVKNMFLVLLPGHFCEVVMVTFYSQHIVVVTLFK